MTIEVTHADEVCESKLFQRCRSSVSNRLCGRHRLYQRFGQDEIRQPQSRKQNFGERSQVNSAALPVESGQRLKWWSVIAIFTVVVILNDECPDMRCPIRLLKTSHNLEDYSSRKLVRWSDVCKPDRASSRHRF